MCNLTYMWIRTRVLNGVYIIILTNTRKQIFPFFFIPGTTYSIMRASPDLVIYFLGSLHVRSIMREK